MRMGVVADDVTGANDIGDMFAKSGYLVHVYSYAKAGDFAATARVASRDSVDEPDIVILDTNSRLDRADVARGKVLAATRELADAGCGQFHNKTCSVFRGNIGVEFDAMLDALGLDFAVVVLGFPKNGRITRDGIHYVHGVPLAESEFRHDPIHPMTRSDLVGILQAQTPRRVTLVDHRTVDAGPAALRERISALRGTTNYVILDVADQAALRTIAAAIYDEPVICGSSAIAEELPAHWGPRSLPLPPPGITPAAGRGVLVAAGSLMPQTASQITYLRETGVPGLELDTLRLLDPVEREAEIERVAAAAADRLVAGQDVLMQAPNEPEQVAATRAAGASAGLSPTETARQVSAALAEAVGRTVERCDVTRLAIAGGETSAAVCGRLGVRGFRVWQEIQPGLPSCISLPAGGGEKPLLLVLKSGSFGSRDFLAQAIEHLKAQGDAGTVGDRPEQ